MKLPLLIFHCISFRRTHHSISRLEFFCGFIPPVKGFLEGLRELCTKHGSALIFDEVMTGFRVAPGGANELYDIDADLLTFGKIIGGGLPIGAYGGKTSFMQQVAPAGPIYQAGTLSGNPVAVTAGIETLKQLSLESYEFLEKLGQQLESGIQVMIDEYDLPLTQHRVGSMFSLFFTSTSVKNINDVMTCNFDSFNKYFHFLLEHGVYITPSQYEAGFISTAHNEENITMTLDVIRAALKSIYNF